MTNEEFNRQKDNLSTELRWEALIRLYRRYVGECRQNGDPDPDADPLSSIVAGNCCRNATAPCTPPTTIGNGSSDRRGGGGSAHPTTVPFWKWSKNLVEPRANSTVSKS